MREDGGQSEELVEFLKTRRWFGEKGRVVRDARLRDAIPVDWPDSRKTFAICRAQVATDAGKSSYQLFALAEKGEARVDSDALEDPEFQRGLANAWLKGAAFERAGTRWIVESDARTPLVVPANAPITLSRAEQTNSSLILNREAILKLYRKLEPGIHPDVEVTRFLTIDREFVHVPVLLGTIRFEDKDGVTIAGMLQEYVKGAMDGWGFALERLRKHFTGAPGDDSEHPFSEEAEQLGNVTRALHESLASGDPGSDFDLRPALPDDVSRWERSAGRTVELALAALDRALQNDELPRDGADQARVIQKHRSRISARIKELAASIATDAGGNTRTHGDLHLGQTLRSAAAQFLVIDFEGEPTRPLAERRARSSPLRDVAGMLRSFAYVAMVAAGSGTKAAARAERWEDGTRAAFLQGYFSETRGRPGLLPKSPSSGDRLITLFELEKSFYELQYELDHRPDWVWIPLRGINRLLA